MLQHTQMSLIQFLKLLSFKVLLYTVSRKSATDFFAVTFTDIDGFS